MQSRQGCTSEPATTAEWHHGGYAMLKEVRTHGAGTPASNLVKSGRCLARSGQDGAGDTVFCRNITTFRKSPPLPATTHTVFKLFSLVRRCFGGTARQVTGVPAVAGTLRAGSIKESGGVIMSIYSAYQSTDRRRGNLAVLKARLLGGTALSMMVFSGAASAQSTWSTNASPGPHTFSTPISIAGSVFNTVNVNDTVTGPSPPETWGPDTAYRTTQHLAHSPTAFGCHLQRNDLHIMQRQYNKQSYRIAPTHVCDHAFSYYSPR